MMSPRQGEVVIKKRQTEILAQCSDNAKKIDSLCDLIHSNIRDSKNFREQFDALCDSVQGNYEILSQLKEQVERLEKRQSIIDEGLRLLLVNYQMFQMEKMSKGR